MVSPLLQTNKQVPAVQKSVEKACAMSVQWTMPRTITISSNCKMMLSAIYGMPYLKLRS